VLTRAIDGLLEADPASVSDGELAEAMVALRREQARLAAVVAEQTAVFDARKVCAADGSRSSTDWIAVHARLPRSQVAGEVRDARRVRSMPRTRAAWRAGGHHGGARAHAVPPGGAPSRWHAFP